jgi:NAD+ diphosphatase
VAREVREETALEIGNLRYFGSQPWPYPCGVMIGFTADYVAGEIRIQEEELISAAWFHRDALPELPMKLSLARRLLDAWLERG